MKRNVIIFLLGFLFYLNPLSAVNKNFESNTCQDSIENLRNVIESQKMKIMKEELEKQQFEQQEVLLKYKIFVYSTISFSILMIGLTIVLLLKNRNIKRILNKQ
jgi:hypothetical protein